MRRLVSVAACLVIGTAVAGPAHAAPAFRAYHGASAAEQARQFKNLRAQDPPDHLQRDQWSPLRGGLGTGVGPRAWMMLRGLSESGMQRKFNELLKQGYQPVSVSATGPAGSATFAAIWEKRSERFLSLHGLTPARFAQMNRQAADRGMAPVSIDVYGTPNDPRYAAVWREHSGGPWAYTYGKTYRQHEAEFKTRVAKGFRPALTAVGPDGTITAIWRKDGVRRWYHYVDTSGAAYQRRFNQMTAKGMYPVQVNVEAGVYASVWQR